MTETTHDEDLVNRYGRACLDSGEAIGSGARPRLREHFAAREALLGELSTLRSHVSRLEESLRVQGEALATSNSALRLAENALHQALPRVGIPTDHATRPKWRSDLLDALDSIRRAIGKGE